MSTNAGAIESKSDTEPPSNSDTAASNGAAVGADSLDSKTETLTTEPSVPDLVDDAKVSGGEIGVVMDNDKKILDESSSDLLESKSGTLIMETETSGGGDIVVQDSIDDARVSVDETGTVMDNSESVLNKSISAAVVSSEPSSNRDSEAVNAVKIGIDSLGSETETLTRKSYADGKGDGDIAVQNSVDDSMVSGDEPGIVMNNSETVLDKSTSDDVASSESPSNRDVDAVNAVKIGADSLGSETETLTMKSSADHNGDGDIAVQDIDDDSRASRDEKGIVMESIEKASDENEVNEEKEGEYKVTDLVWAKVKNYPWWPGQIFDPSSSTDKAKKYSNKKGMLVGYFGDQSFAWNKAPNIKPFRKNFSKLEKQSNSKSFLHAVNCALDEVSRRVDFGLACSCLSKEVYDKVKSQVFVNSGIKKEDSKIDGGDRFSTVSTFKPVKVVQSVQELAREHFDGFSRLEVLSVKTQLLAFFRWKGYYQLQAENILDEPDNKLEAEDEIQLTEENKVVEEEKLASLSKKVSSKKRKPDACDSDDPVPHKKERSLGNMTPKGDSTAKRSKKDIRKKAAVDDDVIKKENGNEKPDSVGEKVSSKKRKSDGSDSDDSVPRKKERSLKNVTPKGNSSAKGSKKDISKKAAVDDDVIKEKGGNEKPDSVGKKASSKKRKLDVSDSDDSVPRKKERSLKNMSSNGSSSVKRSKNNISKKATLKDNEEKGNGTEDKKSPVSSPKKLFRVGDSICRIAKQISESPSILKKESQKSKNDDNSVTMKKTAKKDGQPVEAIQTEE